ncbi:hypothetical protein QTP81_02585 [Alteromonas sp. ASW11-36]|uniref:SGNH/GDSL hydrolase family protein n=1 Tax=Alteromonas arenosi TaxID=3055817 RepID=A0ABT7STJ9_9ALTE|nr:hypothetical protein [Alteromonas sp. ASW11-36]MDM7859491.1 hypothetical protein [Alteromonas sp. ASW11-36]
MRSLLIGLICIGTIGCGSGAPQDTSSPSEVTLPAPSEPVPEDAQIQVLFIGNSHSASNNLSGMVKYLINQNVSGKKALTERVQRYGFLIDHAVSESTLAHLESRDWTHVVLQAQKYSQSFQVDYPITGALSLIAKIEQTNGQAIMFPEWAQRNRPSETEYIHNIHVNIATQTNACIAPIGYAWERALEIRPDVRLHAADGNHASLLGSFLTALVLFETITGEPADLISPSQEFAIDAETQLFLAQMATYAHAHHPACDY